MATQPAYVCSACKTPIADTSAATCPHCGVDFTKVAPTPVVQAYVSPPPLVSPSGASGSRRGWILLGAVIFAAIIAAAGFIGLTNSGLLTPHHTITGTFALKSTDSSGIANVGASCHGTSGYGDISPGAGVTLSDSAGKILATTSLGAGTGNRTECDFSFTLPDVPEVPFYSITVSHRGALSYSLSQMVTMLWTVALTMGS